MNLCKNLQLIQKFRPNYPINGRSLLSSFSLLNWKRESVTNQGRKQMFCTSTSVDSSAFECDELVDDTVVKKNDTQLHIALTELASEFSKECKLSLPGFFTPRCASVISTGSIKLDLELGIGGLPKGRMVEIYGKEASGKTTLALHIIKEAQKLGGYCAYLDAENAMDPMLAEAMGVNTENLLLSYPDSAENMLNVVDTLTQSGSLDVIVVDSVAALVPQCEIDGDIGTCRGDTLSTIMTKALRRIHYSLCRSKTLIVFLNQVRHHEKSNRSLGPRGEVTCGGNALGFYAALRLRTSRVGLLKTNDKPTGVGICVQVVKNKLAPGVKSVELAIKFGKGLCVEPEIFDIALEKGLIAQEGTNYFIEGEVLSSRPAAERYIAENPEVQDKLVTNLRRQLFDKK